MESSPRDPSIPASPGSPGGPGGPRSPLYRVRITRAAGSPFSPNPHFSDYNTSNLLLQPLKNNSNIIQYHSDKHWFNCFRMLCPV